MVMVASASEHIRGQTLPKSGFLRRPQWTDKKCRTCHAEMRVHRVRGTLVRMAVVACARRLRRAARRSAARTLALAILTMLLGAGAVHSTVVPEPAAPAKVQIAEVEHHATISESIAAPATTEDETVAVESAPESGAEPISGHLVAFPGDAARTAAPTRAPPQFLAA